MPEILDDDLHPEGCRCTDCRMERGELSEDELEEIEQGAPAFPERPQDPSHQLQQPRQRRASPPPPPPPPQVVKQRKRRSPTNGSRAQTQYPNTYTQPVPTPTHFHAQFEYAYGPLRRCHLCGAHSDVMAHRDEQVWFATLEDRCRHILEVHTDESDPIIKRERQRSKEILGIADIWNRHAPMKQSRILKEREPDDDFYDVEEDEEKPLLQKLMGKKKRSLKPKKPNWFAQHKVITVILVIGALYGLYMLYLLSQGYEF